MEASECKRKSVIYLDEISSRTCEVRLWPKKRNVPCYIFVIVSKSLKPWHYSLAVEHSRNCKLSRYFVHFFQPTQFRQKLYYVPPEVAIVFSPERRAASVISRRAAAGQIP